MQHYFCYVQDLTRKSNYSVMLREKSPQKQQDSQYYVQYPWKDKLYAMYPERNNFSILLK